MPKLVKLGRWQDRDFVDALRGALQMRPLYFQDTAGRDVSGHQWFFRNMANGSRRFRFQTSGRR